MASTPATGRDDATGPTGATDATGRDTRPGSVAQGWKLAGFVLLVGALIGCAAGVLYLVLDLVQGVFLGYTESPVMPGPVGVPAWRLVASLLTAGVLSALCWWFLRSRCAPVPSVARAVSGSRMPLVPTVVHVLLQIGIVGCGMSIGRETAPRELGAMMGQRYAGAMHLDERDARLITAAAAGAGFAGVYNSPLAGAFFAIEMLLVDSSWRTVAVALGSSCVSAYVSGFIKGRDAFYVLPGLDLTPTPTLVVFALLSAPLWGVAGALFRRGNQWAGSRHARGATILWMLPLVALVTAGVAIVFPQVCGNGRAAAQTAFNVTASGARGTGVAALVGALLALAALKAVLTLLTIRAGASGGVITPAIAIGACLAAALGLGWTALVPSDSVAACALVGAAAVLASSQQAPLMASCLLLELCALPVGFALPVGLACVVATIVARLVLARMAPVTELPLAAGHAGRPTGHTPGRTVGREQAFRAQRNREHASVERGNLKTTRKQQKESQ